MTASPAQLTPGQFERYRRHLSLPEVGVDGQRKLLSARVLLIGAGGLGCPLAQYLAAAGVGTLGLIDHDKVEASNLQRQVLYGTADVGRPKVEVAAERIRAQNPDVRVVTHAVRLRSENALELLADWDVIVDGSDNFPTRYLVNDACVLLASRTCTGRSSASTARRASSTPGRGLATAASTPSLPRRAPCRRARRVACSGCFRAWSR